MLKSGNIINYNSEIYLSQDYVLQNTGITSGYLRVAKSRFNTGVSESWKYIELFNQSYFEYSKIPVTAKMHLPARRELLNSSISYNRDVENIIKTAREEGVHKLLSRYKQDVGTALSAAIIYEAHKYVNNNNISYSKSKFFKELASEIELQQIKYLPKTWRNLRDKIKEYAEGTPLEKIITKKQAGNNNTVKFANNEIIKTWLINFIESQRNYSASHIFRQIRRMSVQSGIKEYPSVRWIRNFMNDPQTRYITQQRFGVNTRFNAKYRVYTPTKSALFAGDCWQIDGTRVNIIDHKATYINKAGKKVTGQKFLYIIAVRDVMSGMILGWEYCYEENATATINALAMAVRNTGYLPYEFIYDRFPGHNSQEWKFIENQLRKEGTIMTVTSKAEGKAHIERWWGTLQSVFMMQSDLYYGEGIKSTNRHAHRSKEYVASMRQWASKNGFNYDMACAETDKIINNYFSTKFSEYSEKFKDIDQSPEELHQNSEKPNIYPITDHQWCFLFGLKKGVQIANYMISTQIEGVKHYYGVDDCDVIAKYTGVKLINCFDYEDLSTVHLYNENEEYVGSFSEIEPAQRFGPDKDMRAVGRVKSIADKVRADQVQKLSEIKEKALLLEDEPDSASEVDVMQGGMMHKHVYESAESAFLLDEWKDEEEIKITVKNQY
jgi:transposase InsO family protein